MTDSLQAFRHVMLVSGVSCAGLGVLLLLLTLWRPVWRWLLNCEESFWKRVGLRGSASLLRRFEESRLAVWLLGTLFGLHLLIFLFALGAYLRYAPRPQPSASVGAAAVLQGQQPVPQQSFQRTP